MRYTMRKQKDKDFHGGKVGSGSLHWCISAGQVLDLSALILLKTKIIQAFVGVIFILVMTLFLVVLGDRVSVVEVGLHLPLWPRTVNNLRATGEFNYEYVHPEEMGMRTLLRDTLRSFQSATQEQHRFSTPKPTSNNKRRDHHLEVRDQDDHQRATDPSPHLENAVPDVIVGRGNLLRRPDDPSSQASTSAPVESHRDRAREVRSNTAGRKGWVEFPDIATNETEQLMLQISQNGTSPCHNVRTQAAQLLGLPQPSALDGGVIRLSAGPVHELTIVSVGDDGRPRCAGGDYYETDLSGPLWKSRPPVLDCNNGTYSVRLQMDPRLASGGVYTLTIILLFSNFHALHYHPQKWARMEEVARHHIRFVVPPTTRSRSEEFSSTMSRSEELASTNSSSEHGSKPSLINDAAAGPELPMCRQEDFSKRYWSGRWTRAKDTEDCEYDRFGRWKCVELDLQCQKPWCHGPLGRLESNGWVYSAHCAFKIFEKEEAWQCLDGKWLFFWGDSNHIDTIRNLLNFVLGFEHKVRFIDRRMDATFFSSPNNQSSVRITSMFNGHSNVTMNYQGLFSLRDPDYAQQLRSFFTGEVAPDVMIMNSGLHDGVYWKDVHRYVRDGVEFAATFWKRVWSEMTARRPDLLYRTTVSTGGSARNMSFNPHKMELFNHLVVDRLLRMELERFQIVDGFDYTYPWHYDHKTNDGVHYGRPPSKSKWAGGNIGHRYFVDLMLIHMLLNAICAPSSSHSDH